MAGLSPGPGKETVAPDGSRGGPGSALNGKPVTIRREAAFLLGNMKDNRITLPDNSAQWPAQQHLEWHSSNGFSGRDDPYFIIR